MPRPRTILFNFRALLVPLIEARRKTQTLRAPRADRSGRREDGNGQPGDWLRLQHGPRFKPQLIGFAACVSRADVRLTLRPVLELELDGEKQRANAMDAFARADGFDDFGALAQFWAETHADPQNFVGIVTRWDPASLTRERPT